LPRALAIGQARTLGDVFAAIKAALARASITEWSVYTIGDDGFALVTHLESIRPDAHPSANRWTDELVQPSIFNLGDYIRALFVAPSGLYRVIVFAVTAKPFAPTPRLADPSVLHTWPSGGPSSLSATVQRMPLAQDTDCVAMIYEFEKIGDRASPRQSSRLQAINHLVGAGLWQEAELRR
jgi:hypothetical protein